MESSSPLHIVLFPWQAFGHMIPYLELAKSLASRGHLVSFLSTPRNIDRLPTLPSSLISLLRFVPLTYPSTSSSLLPVGAECSTDLPLSQTNLLFSVFDSLDKPVADFLSTASPKPDWVIHDFAPFWLPPIASKLCIPCALFSTFPSFFTAFTAILVAKLPISLPAKVEFRAYEVKEMLSTINADDDGDNGSMATGNRWKTVQRHCKFVALRSCDEFDGEWLQIFRQIYDKPVVPVGLLPPAVEKIGEGNKFDEWLTKQSLASVVYVSMGTEATLTTELYHELALGIELSGLPFFWALRRPPGRPNNEDLLPDGFPNRTAGRGFVTMDWVPQREILAHPAVGGFLTHCGWSSIVEGLGFGRPLVALPMLFDQGVNAQVMAQKKVGVEIERNEADGSFTRDAVAKALRLVLVEEEGKEIREIAGKMKEVCGNKDCNEKYVDELVKFMRDYKNQEEALPPPLPPV